MRVLLIEDDESIARGIRNGLRAHHMAVDHVATAAIAEAALACATYRVGILDLGLPDEDGLSLLRRWRSRGVTLPILILSARDSVQDRVNGLRAGADDYVLKPFDLDELVARLDALTRRSAGRSTEAIVRGGLRVDRLRGRTMWRDVPVELSRREMALLTTLLDADGRILSLAQLQDSLYELHEDIESNAVNVHIHHLRKKLHPDLIETVRGLGYRFGSVCL